MRDLGTLPKAHLHVHLESAVRPSTVRELARDHGVTIPETLLSGSHEFGGFADFFALNDLMRGCLRRPDDFYRAAYERCADEAADGTGYVELSVTAAAHGERLGDPTMPLESVLAGLAEGAATFGIEYGVILDHSRRRSVERAWQTLELATKYAADGVVAVGLAGDEAHAGTPFDAVFAAASERGIHVVHHAGEACGPASIRHALGPGRAERIGHGIRALDDPALVDELRERRVPLEVCPSSNVALGFVRSFDEHPLPRLRAAGLLVTVNTDIPTMLGTTLTDEYARVRSELGLDDAALADLAGTAVDASFAQATTKARLRAEIDAWLS